MRLFGMYTPRLITFIFTFFFTIGFVIFQQSTESWLRLTLGDISSLIYPLVFIALFFEILPKVRWWQYLAPVNYIKCSPVIWPDSTLPELSRYTSQLEQLGFVYCSDYRLSSTLAEQVTSNTESSPIRIFVHPKESCVAEVVTEDGSRLICKLSVLFEGNWSVTVTNFVPTPRAAAEAFVYICSPRQMIRSLKEKSVTQLFQSLLTLRDQVSTDLGITELKPTNGEVYFNYNTFVIASARSRLLRKSMIWSMVKAIRLSGQAKMEWLGEYKPFSSASS